MMMALNLYTASALLPGLRVLPIMGYTGRLRLKGVPFLS